MLLAWMEEGGKGGIEMSVVEEEGGVVPGEEEEELSDHGDEGSLIINLDGMKTYD